MYSVVTLGKKLNKKQPKFSKVGSVFWIPSKPFTDGNDENTEY